MVFASDRCRADLRWTLDAILQILDDWMVLPTIRISETICKYACDMESMAYAKILMKDMTIILKSFGFSCPSLPMYAHHCAYPFRMNGSQKLSEQNWHEASCDAQCHATAESDLYL